MFPHKLNSIEPPWYGPVCPVVWEGRCREASPYPDLRRIYVIAERPGEGPLTQGKAVIPRGPLRLLFMPLSRPMSVISRER